MMARGNCTFRQRDVEAALKAAAKAGLLIEGVEIDKDGKIKIIVEKAEKKSSNGQNENSGGNPWDNIS